MRADGPGCRTVVLDVAIQEQVEVVTPEDPAGLGVGQRLRDKWCFVVGCPDALQYQIVEFVETLKGLLQVAGLNQWMCEYIVVVVEYEWREAGVGKVSREVCG